MCEMGVCQFLLHMQAVQVQAHHDPRWSSPTDATAAAAAALTYTAGRQRPPAERESSRHLPSEGFGTDPASCIDLSFILSACSKKHCCPGHIMTAATPTLALHAAYDGGPGKFTTTFSSLRTTTMPSLILECGVTIPLRRWTL